MCISSRGKEMSRYMTNDCVGCPQGCIHCGRDINYYIYECDVCGEQMYEDEVYFENNQHFCKKCWEKLYGELGE